MTAVVLTLATAASAAPSELSVSDRLDDRRYVASGTRGYLVGVESGDFPALGWHTRGEMGGIWSPPLKLLDGIWFALDGQWLPPASRFTSGQGYVRMDYPETAGLRVSRRDFVPDGRRAALIDLSLRSTGDRSVSVWVDAHSELMSVYPWGETTPSQSISTGRTWPRSTPRGSPSGRRASPEPPSSPRNCRPLEGRSAPASAARTQPPSSAVHLGQGSRRRRRAARTPPTARARAGASATS